MLATQVSGVQLYAVAETGGPTRAQVGDEVGVSHTFADGLELIALPELDAVVIATPTSTHHDLVIAAANAGKAIFCEKPLALTLAENHEVLAAVARAQVPLQVGFMRRFDAAYQRAKKMIAAGQIGGPVTFKAPSRDPFSPPLAHMIPATNAEFILAT